MAEAKDGRFAYDGLDRTLHEKARLGILTALVARRDGLAFTDLARLCALTDGNLSRHLDVLAEEGLVQITKTFANRRPLTTCTSRPGCAATAASRGPRCRSGDASSGTCARGTSVPS